MIAATQAVNSVLLPLLANQRGDGRTLRVLTTVVLPDDQPGGHDPDEQDGRA